MQKKHIAILVSGLGLATGAFAQSNVTIYGIVDAAYIQSSGKDSLGRDTKFSGVVAGVSAGSRLGFKGEEALGNGLKAIYTLEYSINNDIDAGVGSGGALAARQQFVGLTGNWGSFTLGRQYAPGYMASARNDTTGAIFTPQAALGAYGGSTMVPGSSARISNALAYASPSFSGLTLSAIYGYGENVAAGLSRKDDGFFGLGTNYVNGPLNVDLAYHNRMDRTAAGAATGQDIEEWYLGGTYNFGMAKLHASWQNKDDETVADNPTQRFMPLRCQEQKTSVGAAQVPHLGQTRWINARIDVHFESE